MIVQSSNSIQKKHILNQSVDDKIKMQESIQTNKKKRGRPKRQPHPCIQNISDTASKSKQILPKIQQKNRNDQKYKVKIQSQRKKRLEDPNLPSQKQLCEALILFKQTLPHRSLEKIIIKMYQVMTEKQNRLKQSQTPSNSSVIQKKSQDPNNISSLLLPGRKMSKYHEMFPINNNNNQQINGCIIQKQIKIQQSAVTHQAIQKVVFHFKFKQEGIKLAAAPFEQQKHNQRKQIATYFIERGWGCTKNIDDDLPTLPINRRRFRNLLGGVLTVTIRRLQLIILKQCNLKMKFLDSHEIKTLLCILTNCRTTLDPINCQTFLKIIQLTFGLADVTVGYQQIIQLYINIAKHLFGQNTNLESLKQIGRLLDSESAVEQIPQANFDDFDSLDFNDKADDNEKQRYNLDDIYEGSQDQ